MLGRIAITNKIVASTLSKDEKEVESVMNFFFKELKMEFKKCEHPYLYVKDLGTFGINRNQVNKRLTTVIHKLKFIRNNEVLFKNKEKYQMYLKGITGEIFFLFRVRRLVKERNEINNKIRRDGKILRNIERKLLQTDGEE